MATLVNNKIPVIIIISGLAGAGKTVLLNYLCENNAGGPTPTMQGKAMAYTGGEMKETIMRHGSGTAFLIIENNITTNPLNFLKDMQNINTAGMPGFGKAYLLGKLVTVIDCSNFVRDYSGIDEEAGYPHQPNPDKNTKEKLSQLIANADVIILNKADLISTAQLAMIKSIVQLNNEDAVILVSSYGKIPAAIIINTDLVDKNSSVFQIFNHG